MYVRGPSQDRLYLASQETEAGETTAYWWVGKTGEGGAVAQITDRHGMRWTLEAEPSSLVTQRVAAGLLRVSIMTVNKWVREGVFGRQIKRDRVSVIPMREVQRMARNRGVFDE